MTDQPPLYIDDHNGEPVVSTAGMALLLGVELDDLRAEMDRQDTRQRGGFNVPEHWRKNGVRLRKRIAAELGHEPTMREALDHLARSR